MRRGFKETQTLGDLHSMETQTQRHLGSRRLRPKETKTQGDVDSKRLKLKETQDSRRPRLKATYYVIFTVIR